MNMPPKTSYSFTLSFSVRKLEFFLRKSYYFRLFYKCDNSSIYVSFQKKDPLYIACLFTLFLDIMQELGIQEVLIFKYGR